MCDIKVKKINKSSGLFWLSQLLFAKLLCVFRGKFIIRRGCKYFKHVN